MQIMPTRPDHFIDHCAYAFKFISNFSIREAKFFYLLSSQKHRSCFVILNTARFIVRITIYFYA